MEKTNMILVRNKHKDLNNSISIISDNMKLYNDSKDTFIWDDVNELLHVLRPNMNYRNNIEKPISFESFEYEMIQFVSSIMNINDLIDLLDGFVVDGLLTVEQRNDIIKVFNSLKQGSNPLPGTNA